MINPRYLQPLLLNVNRLKDHEYLETKHQQNVAYNLLLTIYYINRLIRKLLQIIIFQIEKYFCTYYET